MEDALKIWFLTRSLDPYQKTGGGQIRSGQVSILRELGHDVMVVMPSYGSSCSVKEEGMIQIPYKGSMRINNTLQRLGVIEDYLDFWIKDAVKLFKQALQNAGRCIRSETDRGSIIYLDERYGWSIYSKYFPQSTMPRSGGSSNDLEEFFSSDQKK